MERQLLAWGKPHTSLSGSPGHPSTYPALPSSSRWMRKDRFWFILYIGLEVVIQLSTKNLTKIYYIYLLFNYFYFKKYCVKIKENKNEAEDQTSCSVMRSTHSCRSSLSSGVRIFRISCSSWPSTRMRKLRTSDMKRLYMDSSCSSVDHQRAIHSRWQHHRDSISNQ